MVKYLPNKEGFCKYWFSFNDEDEKIMDSNGVHVYGYEHDAKGNCVLTRFHDIYGKQIKNKDGYYLIMDESYDCYFYPAGYFKIIDDKFDLLSHRTLYYNYCEI